MKWLFLLLFFPFSLFSKEPFAFFDPPKGWHFASPSKFERGVKVGFIERKRALFTPAITLTFEKVGKEVTMVNYIAAVKKMHQNALLQELGTIQTQSGTAHLLQIDVENQWGKICLLQAISLYEGYAILLTTSSLKKEQLRKNPLFLKSFQSLTVTPSLFETLNDPTFEKKVGEIASSFKVQHDKISFFEGYEWKEVTSYLKKHFSSKGECWNFLAAQSIQQLLIDGELS